MSEVEQLKQELKAMTERAEAAEARLANYEAASHYMPTQFDSDNAHKPLL